MDDDRDFVEAGHLSGAQSPLARDQLITREALAHQQRLQDAVHPDGIRQLLQRRRIEGSSRLLRVRLDVGDRDLKGEAPPSPAFRAQILDVFTRRDQGLETPPQSPPFVHLAISSFVSSW